MKTDISIHKPSRHAPRLLRMAPCVAVGAIMFAVSATAFSADAYPKPIQEAVDAGVTVVKTFPAASGLTGWVMAQGGQYSIVFTTQDKKTLLVGALIGENGENLSAQYEENHVPKPDMSALFQELEKSSYVAEGSTKNPKSVIYVFVDANCPFCHFEGRVAGPLDSRGHARADQHAQGYRSAGRSGQDRCVPKDGGKPRQAMDCILSLLGGVETGDRRENPEERGAYGSVWNQWNTGNCVEGQAGQGQHQSRHASFVGDPPDYRDPGTESGRSRSGAFQVTGGRA
jgi:thiol:disulfide interchange protein DsbG